MNTRGSALSVAMVLLAACGSPPDARGPKPAAAEPRAAAPSGHTVRTMRIDAKAFADVVQTDLETARKWGKDPANAKHVLPVFRHILVKAPAGNDEARAAARRKADDLLGRLARGEDFATLAKSSDDPGSADKGGAYPGKMVEMFVPEIRRAYAELSPGGDETFVVVELRPEGAKRLEAASRELVDRRVAIIVDGVVNSAPIVKAALTAGRLELWIRGATPAARRASAERVAKALVRR